MADDIVVVGGGGHAKVLISILKKAGYAVRGYTDKEDRGFILGVRYLGNDDALTETVRICPKAIVGVGKLDASPLRLRLQDTIAALGFGFPVVRSPDSIVNEEVSLGAGTTIFDGVVITSGTIIGRACIINTGSMVDHDCQIGDNVHIAPGVTLSGGVAVGDNCLIGTGTSIIQSISICADCIIGAGSTIIRDITTPGKYAGNPARRIG